VRAGASEQCARYSTVSIAARHMPVGSRSHAGPRLCSGQ